MKYIILFMFLVALPKPANAFDRTTCQALQKGFETHMKYAETPGIDVEESLAELLKALNYMLLYQIQGCKNEKLFTLLYPSSYAYHQSSQDKNSNTGVRSKEDQKRQDSS